MSISTRSRARGLQRLPRFKYYYVGTEMGKQIHFRAQHCQKYGLYEKMLQMNQIKNRYSFNDYLIFNEKYRNIEMKLFF